MVYLHICGNCDEQEDILNPGIFDRMSFGSVSSFEVPPRQLNEMPQVVARGQGEQGQHRLKK